MRLTSFHIKCIYLTVFVFMVLVIWIVVMKLCKWWSKRQEAERLREELEMEEERQNKEIEQLPPISKLIEIYTGGKTLD